MENVVISEALCFIRNNFDKITVSELKSVLVTFYNDDELCNAKETLLKAVTKAVEEIGRSIELPRIPIRRVGDNKRQHLIDDLLKLFTIVDEQKLSTPSFVASDLSRVPFLNADSMNMVAMIRKMDSFERRLAEMEQCYVRDSSTTTTSVEVGRSHHVAVSHLSSDMPNDGADGVDVDETANETVNEGAWNVVTRRHRPPTARNSQIVPTQKPAEIAQQKRKKLVGTARNSEQALKPGVDIVRKSVIHVDNLDINCTPELLKDYLLSKDIAVLSCYATKSWLRDDEKEKVTAFRICVAAEHRDSVMNASIWSKGIVLRDWKFKGNTVQNKAPHYGAGVSA